MISLFGELGGLYEVLAKASLIVLCFIQSDNLGLDMIEKLFHINDRRAFETKTPISLLEREKIFKPVKVSAH